MSNVKIIGSTLPHNNSGVPQMEITNTGDIAGWQIVSDKLYNTLCFIDQAPSIDSAELNAQHEPHCC